VSMSHLVYNYSVSNDPYEGRSRTTAAKPQPIKFRNPYFNGLSYFFFDNIIFAYADVHDFFLKSVRWKNQRDLAKNFGGTTLRVPESSLTSVLTKPVVA
jgi:hypothetical protein